MKRGGEFYILVHLIKVSLIIPVLILAFCNAVWAGSATKSVNPEKGGVLRICTAGDPYGLGWPSTMRLLTDRYVSSAAVEALARYDDSGQVVPYLAEKWDVDASAKTITIYLKKGIKFHDGEDFNANSCKWNLDIYRKSPRPDLKAVGSIDVVDDYTVRLNLSKWNNSILSSLLSPSGYMISPAAYKKNGKDWCGKNPVGTGPFKFVNWDRDVKIVFERFNNYWQKGKPYLDRVEFIPIPDPMVRVAAFRKGDVDVLISPPAKDTMDLEALGKYTIIRNRKGLGAGEMAIFGDSIHPDSPFSKLKVRKAVSHAIDKKGLVEALMKGASTVTGQWGLPGNWGYNPDLRGFPYDPEKAKALLAEAGYPNGINITLYCGTDQRSRDFSVAIQGQLSKVGIKAKIDAMQKGRLAFLKYAKKEGKKAWKNGLILGWIKTSPDIPAEMTIVVHSNGDLYTHGLIHPKEIDDLIDNALKVTEFEKKKALTHELQRVVFEKHAIFTPLHVPASTMVKYPKVRDDGIYMPDPTAWTLEQAWIKK
ncbi:ABC transporter substrate-binding protein [Thermodesulfobacteriota bacterium]